MRYDFKRYSSEIRTMTHYRHLLVIALGTAAYWSGLVSEVCIAAQQAGHIQCSERTLHITADRKMPHFNAVVIADGIPAAVMDTTEFEWRAVVTYKTRQAVLPGRSPVDLPPVEFKGKVVGAQAPSDLFSKAIIDRVHKPGFLVGGNVDVWVDGITPSGRRVAAFESGLRIVGENPEPQLVYPRLKDGFTGGLQAWIIGIACYESKGLLQQFVPLTEPAVPKRHRFPGEPFMNESPGDGGVGIMQISPAKNRSSFKDPPRPADYWDWQQNIETGKANFKKGYEASEVWQVAIQKLDSFKHVTQRTIGDSQLVLEVPRLDDYPIEDIDGVEKPLGKVALLEYAARRYNGRTGTSEHLKGMSQDEFVPKTVVDTEKGGPVFVTKSLDNSPDGNARARIIWRRVFPRERGVKINERKEDYVQSVSEWVRKGQCK